MLTLKQIKKEVEKQGLNFDEWRKNIIDKKMLALISKEKDYYSYWELRELNDSLFKLLLNKSSNKNNSYSKNDSKSSHKNAISRSDKEIK
ncbi:hypothetical protein SE1UMMC_06885 [Staphylococcus epidermidis]|uniref:Uncharacterized protein n=3 Tax=Bacteria TaxID=2 RepID=W1WHY0_ECOLX|nr:MULTISPECIES: hypothetical protein [Staphylococcus]EHQ73338.1 hypothetical protein SEVCU057_0741 [Staphylococcus epidermidis VCU057]EON79853.1 hypothetical protein H700_12843 [Staphylococcus epidermidis 41tr]ETJ17787.1 MAG: hypothetical protein Q609_ECAC02115G0004 [Escherichia coli DORA_A_5_14_21]MDU1594238.1 hypothetical protein [Staphylococcus lugdunensis]MDU1790051.1 hypothetical protein [Streptococcus thermophilus]MDU6405986.1 hypothetical protein [Bradyrhizobium sp.]MDU7037855.1 hypo